MKRESWKACTEHYSKPDFPRLSKVALLWVILRVLQISPPLMPPFWLVSKPRLEYLQQCRGRYDDVSPHLCSVLRFLNSCCPSISYSSWPDSSIEGGCPGCWKWKSVSTGGGLYPPSSYLSSRKTVGPTAVRVPKLTNSLPFARSLRKRGRCVHSECRLFWGDLWQEFGIKGYSWPGK